MAIVTQNSAVLEVAKEVMVNRDLHLCRFERERNVSQWALTSEVGAPQLTLSEKGCFVSNRDFSLDPPSLKQAIRALVECHVFWKLELASSCISESLQMQPEKSEETVEREVREGLQNWVRCFRKRWRIMLI